MEPSNDNSQKALKECPFCCEQIPAAAKKCKACGETVDVSLRAAEEALRASSRGGHVAQQVVVNGGEGKSGPNHLLHLILTICTGGVWGIVWLLVALTSK